MAASAAGADLWAQLGLGLGDGVRQTGRAVGNWLWHPLASVEGIALALSDPRHGLAAWLTAARHAWAGATSDPAGTAGVMLGLMVCVVACVALTAGLCGLGGQVWQWGAARRDPVRRHGRVACLWRARAMRQERRRGQVDGHGPLWHRGRYLLADLVQTPPMLHRHGLAGAVFLLEWTWRGVLRLASAGVRQAAQQLAYLAVPLALLAAPWIELSVQRSTAERAAIQVLMPSARALADGAGGLGVEALAREADALRAAFAAHRQTLLAPIGVLDARLEAALSALDAQLGVRALDAAVLDHRLDGVLERFAAYRLRWLAELVLPAPDAVVDLQRVPRTWFASRAVERHTLALARQRAQTPDARALLDRLLTQLDAEMAYEWCLRGWDAGEMLKSPLPAVARCGRSS